MFDLRYHVASLAAVFFALVIGILVGVALASHGLGHAERQRLELADEFSAGGDTPLWDALEGQLVEERSGTTKKPADAVVIVRTVAPQTDLATARLLNGLYSELASRPLPVVGVERADTRPSA